MSEYVVDPGLKDWASDKQCKFIDAVNETGGFRSAARALGYRDEDAVRKSIRSLEHKAESLGYSPKHDLTKPVAPSFIVKGVSTYYDSEGKVAAQWVKTRLRDEAWAEAVKEGVREFMAEQEPVQAPVEPSDVDTDVIPWINIGDAHIGMLAHESETGESFDLEVAERELCAAVEMLIDEAGSHERCVIQDMGDMTHYENYLARTEASGHQLDFDARFPAMIRAYSRVMRRIVDKALTKFKYVDVIINQGNHSRTNDIWMAELIRVAYKDTGRVTVLNNDSVFIAYRMGKTFVLCHHSDKCKPSRLAHVMATDYAQDWGETEFRYIDIGHIHHQMVTKEHPGVTVESFNQLAAADKYAHDAGYRSRQSVTMIYRSKTYGEIGRRVLPVQQVRDRIRAAVGGPAKPERRAFSV